MVTAELYPEGILKMSRGVVPTPVQKTGVAHEHREPSAFEMKQATMPDLPGKGAELFYGVRPSIVVDEGETANTFSAETLCETAVPKVANLDVHMSNDFEDQFISKYAPRIFPWALNYDCGGADYPDLFADWQQLEQSLGAEAASSLKARWRRVEGEAPLFPGPYAKMIACRPELQIAGDWMLLPAARNLHWRYAVLRSAFVVCKEKVAPGESMAANIEILINAMESIWKKISSNAAVVQRRELPINGNIGLLFSDDDMGASEKLVLRSYLNVTKIFLDVKRCVQELDTFSLDFVVSMGNAFSLRCLQTDDILL